MNIILYKNSSPDNTINKNLEKIITLEGTLRASTSIINPTINVELVEGQSLITDNTEQYVTDDLNQPIGCDIISNIYLCNYAYIPEFKRYYFIIDISTNQNFIFTFKMKCDVLESYKDNIYDLTAFVHRNAKYYNLKVIDDLLQTQAQETQENVFILYGEYTHQYRTDEEISFETNWFDFSSSTSTGSLPSFDTFRYILTLAVKPNTTDYSMDYKHTLTNKNGDYLNINFNYFMGTNDFYGNMSHDVTSNSPFVVNYVLNCRELNSVAEIFNTTSSLTDNANQQCLISLIAYPFDLEKYKGSYDAIRYGETISKTYGYHINKILNDICVSDFTITDGYLENEKFSIYDKFELMLPFYGFVELKYEQIIDRRLVVLYTINVGSTTGYVRIADITNGSENGVEIFYADVEIGIDVTLNFNNAKEYKRNQIINAVNLGVSGLNSALNFGTALATSGVSSMISTMKGVSTGSSGLTNNVINYLNNTKNYTTKIGKSNNGISQYGVFLRVTKPSFTNNDDNLTKYCGRPLNEYKYLGDLKNSGFTQLDNVTISNMDATKEERNEIKELLESGVYL